MVHWYSAGFRIVSSMGTQLSDAVDIAELEYARLFVNFTRAQLDKIATYQMGQALLGEIGASGNRLTIISSRRAGSQTTPEVLNASTIIDRFPKSFRSPAHSMQTGAAASVAAAQQQKQTWLLANPGQMRPWQLSQSDAYYSRELGVVIGKSPYTVNSLGPMVNKTAAQLEQMIAGTLPIDDETNQRLQLTLYEWLTPGRGINTCITFDAAPTSYCELAAQTDWEKSTPPFIVLAHEMIHAWRMMTGRRIFIGGVGEEHMTTGLPPYTSMKFSENKLRAQAGMAIRDYYTANPMLEEQALVVNVSTPYLQRQQGLQRFWARTAGNR